MSGGQKALIVESLTFRSDCHSLKGVEYAILVKSYSAFLDGV